MQVYVSGSHNLVADNNNSDSAIYSRLNETFDEIDKVDNAFESLRTRINGMNLQHPQHSLYPPVISMIETMVGPIYNNEKEQREFAQNLRMTVEHIMPWQKFLEYSVPS